MKFLIFFAFISVCYASNILIMLPLPFYSHSTNYINVFKSLAEKGHNVTCVSPFPLKNPPKNWKEITIPNLMLTSFKDLATMDLTEINGWYFDFFGLWAMLPPMTEKVLQEKALQDVIRDTTSKYDLIIMETFFGQECFTALGFKYNAPIVNINAAGISPYLTYMTGNHFPSDYVPNFKFPWTDHMSFLERAKNLFFSIWEMLGSEIFYIGKMDSLMRKYFVFPGSDKLPHIHELIKNTSLTLIESHLGLHYPRPLHRNIIEVGGINLRDGEKLPSDIQKFMDEAPNGVLYLSFGSHYKTTTMKPKILSQIISAFSKLKLRIIMKYENDTMPDKPDNIFIGKWLPQASILGHPKCKIFVTHGGLHGVTEGLFQGVPLIGIPLFADQQSNIKFAESIGAGIKLNLNEITEDKLLNAINTIMSNPSYKEKAELRKAILRDNQVTQLDNAIYWIEYVIKYKGAPHLQPASLHIPLYKQLFLDVFLLLGIILISICTILYKTVIFCCRKSVKIKKE